MIRPKYLIFAAVLLMMGYVMVHNERFLVEPDNPVWAHYSKYGWWLLTHGVAGAAAMFLAPLQFSDRLRKRYAGFHHKCGYVYVAGVFALAPFGLYVQYMSEGLDGSPRSFTVLAAVDGLMLVVTTAVALMFARQRRLTQHRQWMTRSYAVALVFFEGRLILGLTGLETAGVEMVQAVIWTCLALSVPLADIVNDWDELRRAATAPRRAPARVDVPPRAMPAQSA
jgi:uncharacterized membrane protein